MSRKKIIVSRIFFPRDRRARGIVKASRGIGTHRRIHAVAATKSSFGSVYRVQCIDEETRLMSVPLKSSNTLVLAGALAIGLLLPGGPLLAQKDASDTAPRPSPRPFHPVVDGRRMQPRRQDICRLLHHSLDCQKANTDALDDDLLRDILRRSER